MKNGMIKDEYGTLFWYVNDQLHRTDGPAVINTYGTQYWYVNDQLHRTDGPAIIWSDGSQYWYLNNNNIPEDDVIQWMTNMDIEPLFTEEQQALFVLTFGGK